jgi:hydrogenase maturation protease
MNGFPENSHRDERAPVLVLGLGNILLSDDGVGPAVLHQMAAEQPRWHGEVEFLDGGTQGLALLAHLSGRRAVVIVDAVEKGEEPGTVYRLTLPQLRSVSTERPNSGHESNAVELLAAAELLNELPDQLFLVGVEPKRIVTGLGLSPAVEKALPAASDQVAYLLDELC